jgi:hypothetical protein
MAFKLIPAIYDVLKLNIENNPQCNIIPVNAALSDCRAELTQHSRSDGIMAHSLTSFTQLDEHATSLLEGGLSEQESEVVSTEMLDDYTSDITRLSAVHISVNGHEPEVVNGALGTMRKADIIQISCPYTREGKKYETRFLKSCNGTESGFSALAARRSSPVKAWETIMQNPWNIIPVLIERPEVLAVISAEEY